MSALRHPRRIRLRLQAEAGSVSLAVHTCQNLYFCFPPWQYLRHVESIEQGRRRKCATEACTACRSSKIRCDMIQGSPCIRCAIEGKDCVTVRSALFASMLSKYFPPQLQNTDQHPQENSTPRRISVWQSNAPTGTRPSGSGVCADYFVRG
jgi:hypothetical protein